MAGRGTDKSASVMRNAEKEVLPGYRPAAR
jgi:hypothetical protein